MTNVKAIVVNYRSSDYVRACLESLSEAGVKSVCVVDNFSTLEERTAISMVVDQAPLDAIFAPLDENLGFGAGVNYGVTRSSLTDNDLLWIINPDAEVNASALASLVSRFENNDADIVSPLILTGERSSPRIWFAGGQIVEATGRTIHKHLGKIPGHAHGIEPAGFLTGAAPMMRVSTFHSLNGFREDLFLYWEDTDLSRRASAAGLRLAVDSSAQIWHAVGGSGDQTGKSAAYYYYMQRNRLIVASAWTSRWNLLFGRGALETIKLTIRPLKEPDDRLAKFFSGLRGVRQGFRSSTLGES